MAIHPYWLREESELSNSLLGLLKTQALRQGILFVEIAKKKETGTLEFNVQEFQEKKLDISRLL